MGRRHKIIFALWFVKVSFTVVVPMHLSCGAQGSRLAIASTGKAALRVSAANIGYEARMTDAADSIRVRHNNILVIAGAGIGPSDDGLTAIGFSCVSRGHDIERVAESSPAGPFQSGAARRGWCNHAAAKTRGPCVADPRIPQR